MFFFFFLKFDVSKNRIVVANNGLSREIVSAVTFSQKLTSNSSPHRGLVSNPSLSRVL